MSSKIKTWKLLILKQALLPTSGSDTDAASLNSFTSARKVWCRFAQCILISLGRDTLKEQKPSDILCFAGSLLWHLEIFLFCHGFGHEVNGNTSSFLLGPALQQASLALTHHPLSKNLVLKASFSTRAIIIERKRRIHQKYHPCHCLILKKSSTL